MKLAMTMRVGLLAGLVAAFVWQWKNAPHAVPPTTVVAASADQSADALPSASWTLRPLEHYNQTIERPLFFADRRPPSEDVAEAPAAPVAVAETQDWVLLGVVNLAEGTRALLQSTKGKDNRARRVKVGDELDQEWRIASISARSIMLRNKADTESKTIEIKRGQKPPANIARTPMPKPATPPPPVAAVPGQAITPGAKPGPVPAQRPAVTPVPNVNPNDPAVQRNVVPVR